MRRAVVMSPAGALYSFFDASKPDLGLWPTFGPPDTLPVSKQNPPKIDPQPMQVVRRHPIHASTMAMKRSPGNHGAIETRRASGGRRRSQRQLAADSGD